MLALVLSLWFVCGLGPIECAAVLQTVMLPQSSFEICNISLNISDIGILKNMFKISKWEMLITVWASENMKIEMSWALKETFYLVKNKCNKLFQGKFWFILYTHSILIT